MTFGALASSVIGWTNMTRFAICIVGMVEIDIIPGVYGMAIRTLARPMPGRNVTTHTVIGCAVRIGNGCPVDGCMAAAAFL